MTHFGDTVVDFFKKAATKIEELQLQSALGKAELSDAFEDAKKESYKQYQEMKADINATIDRGGEKLEHLKAKLEHLELQWALGKAETKEAIEEQKKNLSKAISEVKHLISKD